MKYKQNVIFILAVVLLAGCNTAQPGSQTNFHSLFPFVFSALLVILFVLLAIHTNIVRDEVNNCEEFNDNAQKIKDKKKKQFINTDNPYSLAKVQLGLWTVIIASSYIYLDMLKGDCSWIPINKTALVLMGFGAGTAAASTIMDKREIEDNRPRHQNTPSQGFFNDILSDDNGISIHRFQHLVWNCIAMILYLYKVSGVDRGCILPELSDTLLALTGISSATYLVLRSKENDPAVSPGGAVSENTTPAATLQKSE